MEVVVRDRDHPVRRFSIGGWPGLCLYSGADYAETQGIECARLGREINRRGWTLIAHSDKNIQMVPINVGFIIVQVVAPAQHGPDMGVREIADHAGDYDLGIGEVRSQRGAVQSMPARCAK